MNTLDFILLWLLVGAASGVPFWWLLDLQEERPSRRAALFGIIIATMFGFYTTFGCVLLGLGKFFNLGWWKKPLL